jgi:hypothetical protein
VNEVLEVRIVSTCLLFEGDKKYIYNFVKSCHLQQNEMEKYNYAEVQREIRI